MWIIDNSGPKDDVVKYITDLNYQTMVKEKGEQLARMKTLYDLAQKNPELASYAPTKPEIDGAEKELKRMDAGDEKMFEAARKACLTLIAMVPQTHVGATARPSKNGTEAPKGVTLSIHVAGYDVR